MLLTDYTAEHLQMELQYEISYKASQSPEQRHDALWERPQMPPTGSLTWLCLPCREPTLSSLFMSWTRPAPVQRFLLVEDTASVSVKADSLP